MKCNFNWWRHNVHTHPAPSGGVSITKIVSNFPDVSFLSLEHWCCRCEQRWQWLKHDGNRSAEKTKAYLCHVLLWIREWKANDTTHWCHSKSISMRLDHGSTTFPNWSLGHTSARMSKRKRDTQSEFELMSIRCAVLLHCVGSDRLEKVNCTRQPW